MKPIFRGKMLFGLVEIDIDLFSAIKAHPLSFNILHKVCLNPIHNRRWCNFCDKEVSLEDTVKGVKLPNGKYFVVGQEALEQLKAIRSDAIEVIAFIDNCKISPLYFNEHYFMLPNKKSERAFYLLQEVLVSSALMVICKLTMKQKQYISIIEPYKEGMLLSTLHYGFEIKDFPIMEAQAPKITKEELTLAKKLADSLTITKFDINLYKEKPIEKIITKINKISQSIKPIVKGRKIEPKLKLIDTLRASVKKIK